MQKKIGGSISVWGITINSPEFSRKSLFRRFSEQLKDGNLVIVIDDLERKSRNIAIEDIMGMIEQFSLFPNIKILVIGAEDNMEESDKKKWNEFKEKLIEKEYHITDFSSDAIESIVIGKLEKYIKREELLKFTRAFLEMHKTKNLRSIEKGVNLFLEISETYLKKEYDEKTYLAILKNCMAVAIEFSEELYKPKESDKNTNKNFEESFAYSVDSDINSRIISHYFRSIHMSSKESSILDYVIRFFKGEINDDLIDRFNNVVQCYLSVEDEKNLFYLSEEKIEKIIKERYSLIMEKKYEFKTLEHFIDDIHELVRWNLDLKLGFDFKSLSEKFEQILFDNCYDMNKEESQNLIDGFHFKQEESEEMKLLIAQYNKKCLKKYTKDKIDSIVDSYKDKEYDLKVLKWLDLKLIQEDKIETEAHFLNCCRNNGFLIPDLSGEISESEWSWTHGVWKVFYERISENHKEEFNDYIETKKVNKLSTSRIAILQGYRPLIIKNDEKTNTTTESK